MCKVTTIAKQKSKHKNTKPEKMNPGPLPSQPDALPINHS